MADVILSHEQMVPMYQAELHLDAAVAEGEDYMVFTKVPSMKDPFVAGQKVRLPEFPHHYAGENYISLTAQSGSIVLHRMGLIDENWRGHGTRIRHAVYRATVLLGETLYVRAHILKHRMLWNRLFVTCAFEMWKLESDGSKVVCYESEQEAVFFRAGDEG